MIFTNPVGENGAPLLLVEANETIQRPGVHGTGIRRLGVKGVTFHMISMRDNSSVLAAAQEYNLYTVLTTQVAQPIRFKGVDFDGFGVRYVVLNVSDPDITPVRNKVGGLLGSLASAAILRVTWTLQPVSTAQQGAQLTQG